MRKQDKQVESNSKQINTLSHQLKSPINAIQSLLYAVLDNSTDKVDPKLTFLIKRALTRADEARELISDLLDYAYFSQDREIDKSEVDLVSLLKKLADECGLAGSKKDVSLRVDLPENSRLIVLGSTVGLTHAIKNILDNAVKYTPEHGQVSVKLDFDNKSECRIYIEDTGSGIPEKELDLVFEPFFRSAKHRRSSPGSGLGLSISKKIVLEHGGEIAVSSSESEGMVFTVTLPYLYTEEREDEIRPGKRILIIGGVTAGPKVAARLRRLDENLDITIIEKSEFLSYAGSGLPAFISGSVDSARSLMSTADSTVRDVSFFESIKNIRILNRTLALSIDRGEKKVRVKDLESQKTTDLPYDILVLATGGRPNIPRIPGIRQRGVYTLHNIEDANAIKQQLSDKNARDVCIIGGGLIGIETAQALMEAGARITILEKRSHILLKLLDREFSRKLENELNRKGIKIFTAVNIERIERADNQLVIVTEGKRYYSDLIILSTGVRPDSSLAKKAKLDIWKAGGILVDKHLQTSDQSIYAAGDCAESVNLITKKHEYWPLGSISTKMGRIAADNICGRESEFLGNICTAMFKVFDTNVARTGITTETAKKNGFAVDSITIPGLDKAHYSTDARYIILRIIADRQTKTVLGAQGFGRGDVIARISLLACAITDKLTLDDVFKLDLGYSPSFNNVIDILQTACMALDNKMDGLFKTITAEELEKEREGLNIIDLSPQAENSRRSIPRSINIPLEDIRSERIPFERSSKIVLYSKTSSRAYEAYRFLQSKKYSDLRVLEGGYIYWEK